MSPLVVVVLVICALDFLLVAALLVLHLWERYVAPKKLVKECERFLGQVRL